MAGDPAPDGSRRRDTLAIACGHEDADDLDHLRTDPRLKLACGRLPDTGRVNGGEDSSERAFEYSLWIGVEI